MNQSVYKRDFRDPRDIMRLWKFLLNQNLESNLQHNYDGGESKDSKVATGDCSIKSREGEESFVDVSRTQSELIIHNRSEEKNLQKSKSLSSLPIPKVSSLLKISTLNPLIILQQLTACRDKFKISDFPTIIDRFAHDRPAAVSLARPMSRTEYRDVYNHIGKLIIKCNIHNHSRCGKDGKYCEHAMHALTRRQKMY